MKVQLWSAPRSAGMLPDSALLFSHIIRSVCVRLPCAPSAAGIVPVSCGSEFTGFRQRKCQHCQRAHRMQDVGGSARGLGSGAPGPRLVAAEVEEGEVAEAADLRPANPNASKRNPINTSCSAQMPYARAYGTEGVGSSSQPEWVRGGGRVTGRRVMGVRTESSR